MIGKAVTLSEAIARSDGIPARLKDIFSNIKIAHVTDEVSRALDRMNREIAGSHEGPMRRQSWSRHARKQKTAEQRRECHLTGGFVTMFSGIGLSTFLYFLGHNLVLKLPPEAIAQIPFELSPVIHVLWLVGLIPTFSGLGRIIAGLSIRTAPDKQIEFPAESPLRIDPPAPAFDQQPINRGPYQDELTLAAAREAPASVTDRTTNILERKIPGRQTDEMNQ
ncbi:MAG TPA: hypothetical protein VHE60_03405 [Pyrinomonadaceae bacterium]|nr:hypothetical protein [Pyrinomonadaceae bacterium]